MLRITNTEMTVKMGGEVGWRAVSEWVPVTWLSPVLWGVQAHGSSLVGSHVLCPCDHGLPGRWLGSVQSPLPSPPQVLWPEVPAVLYKELAGSPVEFTPSSPVATTWNLRFSSGLFFFFFFSLFFFFFFVCLQRIWSLWELWTSDSYLQKQQLYLLCMFLIPFHNGLLFWHLRTADWKQLL